MARRPRDLVSYLPLSPSRGDRVALGPGAWVYVMTRMRAARHKQPRSAAAYSARSRTPEACAPGPWGARGASVAPPLGYCLRVLGHCLGGPRSGRLLLEE